jgi:hypothetical protein
LTPFLIDRSGILFEDFSDLLHSGPSSLDSIHFQEPFEHGELPDSRLPLVLRDSHEIRYRNSPLVNRMSGLCLRNRNTFQSPLPNSRAMIASNPVQSTTKKRRFLQRMILPGVNSTDSLLLMFRLLKK